MKQQINLYLPEFRKKIDRLSVANMVVYTGAFVVVLLAVSGYEFFTSYSLDQEIAAKETVLAQNRTRTNALVDSYGVQSEDQQLAAEVRQLEENLQGKRTLLAFLQGQDIGNTAGFSEYLADLSRFHIDGLRLTSIDLQGGGQNIFLRGEVNRAENVPLYLQNLRNGLSYNGKTFETLRISGTDTANVLDTRMTFDVATTGGVQR